MQEQLETNNVAVKSKKVKIFVVVIYIINHMGVSIKLLIQTKINLKEEAALPKIYKNNLSVNLHTLKLYKWMQISKLLMELIIWLIIIMAISTKYLIILIQMKEQSMVTNYD